MEDSVIERFRNVDGCLTVRDSKYRHEVPHIFFILELSDLLNI